MGGVSGRTADLTQVRSTPQRSYGRPDADKVDTLTCRRMSHRKDDGRGERPVASPTPTPVRSQSRSYNPISTEPDFDTLSTGTADSLREQVRRVYQRLDEVQKEVLKSRGEVGQSSKGGSPFTPEIQAKPLPALEPYDGSGVPTEHIVAFQMALYDTSDALIVLDGAETIKVLLVADRATTYDSARDAATGTSVHSGRDANSRQAGRDKASPPKRREDRSGLLPARPPPPIPLNSTRTEIFFPIRERELLKAPSPMKSHPERRDKRRYYRFHREYRHNTEECRDLQYQIKDLIRRGHLRRYVREQSSLPDGRPPRDLSPRPKGPVEKQIDVIFGGPTSSGNSCSVRKAYARSEVGKRPLHDEDLDVTFNLLLRDRHVVRKIGENHRALHQFDSASFVLPPEVVFPTLRVQTQCEEESNQPLCENLDLLEEKRADAHLRSLALEGPSPNCTTVGCALGRSRCRGITNFCGSGRDAEMPRWAT
ncbi:hypothetical protein BHM03_00018995 [Ensete ventricosum]|uniref:Uncharacterized protein n=1 Tax=Ensete ventricosum TaxID=4639 RepID=A0A445MFC9_ENSVE|nr:hypothetical protein BHM03_00018995 [Ensete ventricosum]